MHPCVALCTNGFVSQDVNEPSAWPSPTEIRAQVISRVPRAADRTSVVELPELPRLIGLDRRIKAPP